MPKQLTIYNSQFTIKILLSLFIVACLLFISAPTGALAHGGVDDNELIIRMTKNGFEPKELTVVEGDEVTFINNDDVDRWPASNFHPTHGIYPEFDPLKGVKPGVAWKFTFDKAGTWRMHDHLIPHMTGTIVVLADPGKSATSSPSDLEKTSTEEGFWQKIANFFKRLFKRSAQSASTVSATTLTEFKNLNTDAKYAWLEKRAELESPEVAWQYVLSAYNTPEGVVGSPHDMAHLVGQLLFKRHSLDGLSFCTPVFAFGCYHGLMEVAFDKDHPEQFVKNFMEAQKGCQKIGIETDPSYWSCIHGMGHGAITFREHDTQKALKDCDLLSEKVRNYCYDGVFMELSISATPNFYKKSDPLYPCNAIEAKYRIGCARAQARIMTSRFGLSIQATAKFCRESNDEAIRYNCIDALGYSAGQGNLMNAEKIVEECGRIINGDDQAQCKAAAAGELVFQNAANWQTLAPQVCESMSANYKSKCDERIRGVKKSYGR